jgi:hypothetical protein
MTKRPHRAPRTTVLLGTVLDLQVEHDDMRTTVTHWKGWALLADADSMERAAGRARLFLVPFKVDGPRERQSDDAEDTYWRWHKRNPRKVLQLDVPDTFGALQGRVLRIGYRSDKWTRRGNARDYDHDFREGGALAPLIYTNARTLQGARGACITGGDMRVTERGID